MLLNHPQTNPWCQKRLGTAVLESAFQCLGFLEFAGPAFSRCVPYHNMEDAGLNICVWMCVYFFFWYAFALWPI